MSVVFIHVPRTGGNSLLPHLVDKNTHVAHHVEKENLDAWLGSWFFSFVRDPCQRVISAYAYLRDGGRSTGDDEDANTYIRPFANLEEFVLHGLEEASRRQRHFRPQNYWLSDSKGRIVAHFLGRTERMQRDFDMVCYRCGWDRVTLSIVNESKREGLTCTPAMRSVIEKVYAEDYRLIQTVENNGAMGVMSRILPVFNRNFQAEKRDAIWDAITQASSKVELNERNLDNMCGTNLVYGFGGGLGTQELRLFAEALGVSGIQNAENNAHHNAVMFPPTNVEGCTPDEILDKIQAVLPFKIKFPPFSGNCEQGIQTKYGVASNRHIFYLWVLKRIMELCPDQDSAILEVGAGFGILGYYLDKVGYRDYTSIDLAMVNACQTYFLFRNLPERNLILSGDVPNPFGDQHRDSIKLLHSTDFIHVPKGRFRLMINMDGLTEYGIEAATNYVQSDCATMLLSINHEVNPYRVCDLQQPNRKRQYRYPFWLRNGYVEELYVNR